MAAKKKKKRTKVDGDQKRRDDIIKKAIADFQRWMLDNRVPVSAMVEIVSVMKRAMLADHINQKARVLIERKQKFDHMGIGAMSDHESDLADAIKRFDAFPTKAVP